MQQLIIQSLAVWYISHAITGTHGIFNLFERIRKHDPIGLTTCIVCTSIWVSAAISVVTWLVGGAPLGITATVAAAGAAMLLHKYTGWGY